MNERVTLADRLADEVDDAVDAAAKSRRELVQPSPEEARNGWTPESLTTYLDEREPVQALNVDPNSLARRAARRPIEQNHRYNRHRWRE